MKNAKTASAQLNIEQANKTGTKKEGNWKPVWYTIPAFTNLMPVNLFHREQDEAAEKAAKAAGLLAPKNLHVLARASFFAKEGERIWLRISADDAYQLYLNGNYVAQGPAPAYPSHYYYNEIDLSENVQPGKNVLAVHLYYQGLINRVWNSGDNRFGLCAALYKNKDNENAFFKMEKTMDDESIAEGIEKNLCWKYQISDAYQSGGIIGYETQYLENFDSRRFDQNWNSLLCDDSSWDNMPLWKAADHVLYPQPTKLLSVYEIEPVSVQTGADGCMRIDFGTELAGALSVTAEGKAGEQIFVRCGEELEKDGSVRYDMRCNCRYEESWTLKDGISVLENYDYKGFRYAELCPKGDAKPNIRTVRARVRHYPFQEDACRFSCSSARTEQIFQICKNAVKMGTQEGYLDCPTREKGQYLGDAIVTAHTHTLLTGSTELLRKCIDQFLQTQAISQGLLAVAPGAFMQEIADFSLLFPQLLLLDYTFTGEKTFLASCYPAAKAAIEAYASYARKDGLLENVSAQWNMVDWPENLRDDYDFPLTRPVVAPGVHAVVNALYIGAWKTLQEIQDILADTENQTGLCKKEQLPDWHLLAARFYDVFFREETGLFADSETSMHGSLHANLYPLYFGLVPLSKKAHVADWLSKKGLCCGVMVSYYLLKALAREGRHEAVYRLLTNETEHGWVNMLREGATTAFEAWGKEQKWNTSLCHPWASAPVALLIEDIAGFCPDPHAENGFRLAPHLPKQLSWIAIRLLFRGKSYQIRVTKEGAECHLTV